MRIILTILTPDSNRQFLKFWNLKFLGILILISMLALARQNVARTVPIETFVSDDDDESQGLGEFEEKVKRTVERAWRGEFPSGESLRAIQRDNLANNVK